MIKAKCPNCKASQFVTTVTVTEEWVVDDEGNFIEQFDSSNGETVRGPNKDNTWTCKICGSQAIVKDVCDHVPDTKTVRAADGIEDVMDINCKLCGMSGSFRFEKPEGFEGVYEAEIQWEDDDG